MRIVLFIVAITVRNKIAKLATVKTGTQIKNGNKQSKTIVVGKQAGV